MGAVGPCHTFFGIPQGLCSAIAEGLACPAGLRPAQSPRHNSVGEPGLAGPCHTFFWRIRQGGWPRHNLLFGHFGRDWPRHTFFRML